MKDGKSYLDNQNPKIWKIPGRKEHTKFIYFFKFFFTIVPPDKRAITMKLDHLQTSNLQEMFTTKFGSLKIKEKPSACPEFS